MNYRKYYEKKCNIKIPEGYEIHHIDFNRDNNDIFNLVMLPKKLHNEYHIYLERYKEQHYKVITKLQSSLDSGLMINNYIKDVDLEIIKQFVDIWYECIKYVDYRNFLLGIMPNVYNFGDKILWQ